MNKKDFIALTDYKAETLIRLIKRGIELKNGAIPVTEKRKSLALIFAKPSTRTNISFQRAIQKLGGSSIYLGAETLQIARGETLQDTAKTLSRYVDAVMIRTYSHQDVLDFAIASSVPVINGLTDFLHPCQALGDMMTIFEAKGKNYSQINMAFIGDGNNVCNSLINISGLLGVNLSIACPSGYEPDEGVLKNMRKLNENIKVFNDPKFAIKDADVVYTDIWVSMGQDSEKEDRLKRFAGFQLNEKLLSIAADNYIVMHCLPAHRGEEITNEVIDGKHSYVFEQAENRLHIQEAILEYLLEG